LLLQAASDLGFNPESAVVIGDKESDVEFGRSAGATTIRIAADGQSAPRRTRAGNFPRAAITEPLLIIRANSHRSALPMPFRSFCGPRRLASLTALNVLTSIGMHMPHRSLCGSSRSA
jgi:hypothetical protein